MSHIIHRSLRRTPPVAVSGDGILIHDSKGTSYLDASGGAPGSSRGPGPPALIDAQPAPNDR